MFHLARMNRTGAYVRGVLLCLATAMAGCSMGEKWKVIADGNSFDGWKGFNSPDCGAWMMAESVVLDPAAEGKKFKIAPGKGILVNGADGRTCDIVTVQEYGDCELHLEFTVAKGSNSGVYLLGRYEIQILDSFGKTDWTYSDCGGIYPRWINEQNTEGHKPRVNASKPAGEWQTLDVTFEAARFDASDKKVANAKFVKVCLNGAVIHENVELNGPTRGAIGGNLGPDVAAGPLRLQGDHGPVAFRNVKIRPLKGTIGWPTASAVGERIPSDRVEAPTAKAMGQPCLGEVDASHGTVLTTFSISSRSYCRDRGPGRVSVGDVASWSGHFADGATVRERIAGDGSSLSLRSGLYRGPSPTRPAARLRVSAA